MMLTLAMETSTSFGGVALGDGDSLLGESCFSVQGAHSEVILVEADRLLARVGKGPEAVRRVVVGSGPGSFTGVRIAAALAKGWCQAMDIPLYAYSSLRTVAAGAWFGCAGTVTGVSVCALFDARRNDVYGAAYADGPVGPATVGPVVAAIGDLISLLGEIDSPSDLGGSLGAGKWVFAGEGAIRHSELIEGAGGVVAPQWVGAPRAAALLWLAEHRPGGHVDEIGSWEPGYVRASGAERVAGAP